MKLYTPTELRQIMFALEYPEEKERVQINRGLWHNA